MAAFFRKPLRGSLEAESLTGKHVAPTGLLALSSGVLQRCRAYGACQPPATGWFEIQDKDEDLRARHGMACANNGRFLPRQGETSCCLLIYLWQEVGK
jgi:hypothetical protein